MFSRPVVVAFLGPLSGRGCHFLSHSQEWVAGSSLLGRDLCGLFPLGPSWGPGRQTWAWPHVGETNKHC